MCSWLDKKRCWKSDFFVKCVLFPKFVSSFGKFVGNFLSILAEASPRHNLNPTVQGTFERSSELLTNRKQANQTFKYLPPYVSESQGGDLCDQNQLFKVFQAVLYGYIYVG